jgi:hypothetical protein
VKKEKLVQVVHKVKLEQELKEKQDKKVKLEVVELKVLMVPKEQMVKKEQ